MVPLPLAAGPSTAITMARLARGPFGLVKAGSVKRGALTVGHAYGKAPPFDGGLAAIATQIALTMEYEFLW